jgi:quercetin dioxygenase-like cupin family protein
MAAALDHFCRSRLFREMHGASFQLFTEKNMSQRISRFTLSALLTGLLVALNGGAALAGECPAGKAANNPLANAPSAPAGVKDVELSSIDLSKENVKLSQRRLRMRAMTIDAGGIVPLHDHADRPALIMVKEGEILEFSSKCSEPILHKAGDIAREFAGTKHHWKNASGKKVELMIADIVNDKKPETMKEMM